MFKTFFNKHRKIIANVTVLLFFIFPLISYGAGIVTCGTEIDPATGLVKTSNQCSFSSAIEMLDKLMKYALVLSFSMMIIVTVWTGFKYITSQGDPGKVKDAKNSFKYIIYGIFFMLMSWVIVYTLEKWFLRNDDVKYWSPFLLSK